MACYQAWWQAAGRNIHGSESPANCLIRCYIIEAQTQTLDPEGKSWFHWATCKMRIQLAPPHDFDNQGLLDKFLRICGFHLYDIITMTCLWFIFTKTDYSKDTLIPTDPNSLHCGRIHNLLLLTIDMILYIDKLFSELFYLLVISYSLDVLWARCCCFKKMPWCFVSGLVSIDHKK